MQEKTSSMSEALQWRLQVKTLHLHMAAQAQRAKQEAPVQADSSKEDFAMAYKSTALLVQRFQQSFAGKIFFWLNRPRFTASQKKSLRVLEASTLFDSDWYNTRYPDVQLLKLAAVEHFVLYGWRERRNPGPDFDTAFYLSTYADVRQAGVNPLEHYIRFGVNEGRKPVPGVK